MERTAAYRTLEAKPSENSIIKPGELVDLVEMTPLTLNDRRIYNQLLAHAWDRVQEPGEHVIAKRDLRGSHNANDRVGDSIERLMAAIVKVRVVRDGERAVERVQLLGSNTEHESPDGMLRYEFPARLREIIKESTIFARLQKEVMFALSSKYALALYEMVQKRGNMTMKSYEDFDIGEFRELLGVPRGKLPMWGNLHQRALAPAIKEVNALSDYTVELEPLKTGRKISGVRMRWSRKEQDEVSGVMAELKRPKVGRKARIEGRVEDVSFGGRGKGNTLLRTETYEEARRLFPGYDIYHIEQEWRTWMADKEDLPQNPDRAYLGFFAGFVDRNPLR
jgi:nucleoside diphosphate kinase